MVDLRGAVTLVTGANRGIGRATAELLALRGASVVCAGRDRAELEAVAARCGGFVVVADLLDPAGPEELVQQALARYGRLDAVVINAGIGYVGAVVDMSAAQIAALCDLNVRAALLTAAAGAKAIRAGGRGQGSIVFVSSIAGAVGVAGESVYSATKAALEAFAPLLREELRADGIAVGTVVPGVVDTDFHRARGVPYTRRFPKKMPPQRVAAAIVRAVQSGTPRQVVPRWLAVPGRLSVAAPRLYRTLARQFG